MKRWVLVGTAVLVVLAVALAVGPTPIDPIAAVRSLFSAGNDPATTIVRDLRAPRVLLAFLVGGSLGVTGAALQALVRNPLADPYLLGLSGGAGLGAVVAISLGLASPWAVPLAALAGALVAIVLVYRLALIGGGGLDARVLLLGGVVVGAFAASVMGAVIAVSPAPQVRNALLWLLGSFGRASWPALAVFSAYAVVPLAVLYRLARQLDLLTLGEEPAEYLGTDLKRTRTAVYVAASLLTAAAVSLTGIIGFVGLVVPHAVRFAWSRLHLTLLPASFLVGGALLVVADAVARTVAAPLELPVGVVTALVGVPVFVVLVRRWAA